MATNTKDVIPARATHPGSVLKRELQARGIKQKDFAKSLGMPAPNLSELIKGKRHISEAIAMKLEEVLGIPFQTWMNLQSRYHYVMKRRAEIDSAEANAALEEQSLSSRLNLRALYQFFNIGKTTATQRISELKSKLAIDLNELQALEVNTVGFFKRSDKLKIDDVNMRTWLLLAWSEASRSILDAEYNPVNGEIAASEISEMANAGNLNIVKIKDILNKNGIIYIQVPKLEAAPIDAYSVMSGSHPAIVVTYRHNDLDKLAFDILHEIGHILSHLKSGKSYISVETDYSTQSKEEKEADQFANDMLIAPDIWDSIMTTRPESISPYVVVHTIANEAKKRGISPSIAVARYKHDTRCYNIRGYRSPKIC